MTETVYTLAEITQRLGPSTEAEVRQELEGFANDDFIAKGRRVATPRLAKELARNYGVYLDWLPNGTQEQKQHLSFVGLDWLRIAAFAAYQAEIHHESLSKGESLGAAAKNIRTADADKYMQSLKQTRESIHTSLSNVAAGLTSWTARVESAYSTPDTLVPMTDSVQELANVADTMLAEATEGMKTRLARNNINPATIQQWRDLAQKTHEAQRAASAVRSASTITQADVDVWDGIALTFFEQFVNATACAHHIDPAIPAASIIGLRSWFYRTAKKHTPEPTPTNPATTPNTSGT